MFYRRDEYYLTICHNHLIFITFRNEYNYCINLGIGSFPLCLEMCFNWKRLKAWEKRLQLFSLDTLSVFWLLGDKIAAPSKGEKKTQTIPQALVAERWPGAAVARFVEGMSDRVVHVRRCTDADSPAKGTSFAFVGTEVMSREKSTGELFY